MAVTETYLREEFNHKYVGLDGLDFWIMCLDMGWRMGLEVEFQEEKISSKCFISLLLKKKEYVIGYLITPFVFQSPRSNCRERGYTWTWRWCFVGKRIWNSDFQMNPGSSGEHLLYRFSRTPPPSHCEI